MSRDDGILVTREQASFVARELRRGVMPGVLKASLRKAKWPEPLIKALMGPAFEGNIAQNLVDHDTIYNARICELAKSHPDIRQVATPKAQVFTWSNFLKPDVCDRLIAQTEALWRDSTVADAFADPKIRTSRTADIGTRGDALIFSIDQAMGEALGFHWSYSDPSQTQRYEPGQEYKAHHDYFTPGSRDYQVECQDRGQRTWTFMVYLSEVEDGGGTRFRKLDKMFMPERGSAVIWNNLNRDGSVNPWTLHHGMKVRKGTKYIITKWFRERGWGPIRLKDRPASGTLQAP
ncbi:MAG: 2OG-Fe(II) oxygenase [Pseudomonadota bacterium]